MDGLYEIKIKLRQNWSIFNSDQDSKLRRLIHHPINANGNDLIPMSYSIWYLGGYLDTNLTFSKHVKQKVKAAMANFVKIWSIRKNLFVSTCTTLVLMLCISHIDYINAMLYGTTKIGIKQIPNPAKCVQN